MTLKITGYVFAIILLMFILIQIKTTLNKWKITFNLPRLHKVEAIFSKNGVFMALGHFTPLETLLLKDFEKSRSLMEAMVLKRDTKYDHWKKVYSGKGELFDVSYQGGGDLFALGWNFRSNMDIQAFLIKSDDFGETWVDLPPPPDRFLGIDFSFHRTAYAWSDKYIYRTKDDGKTWEQLSYEFSFSRSGPHPALDKDMNLFVPMKSNVFIIDSKNNNNTYKLPNSLKLDSISIAPDNTKLILASHSELKEKLYILKFTKRGDFEIISEIPWILPNGFHVWGDIIAVMGSEMNVTPPKKVLILTRNRGKDWKIEVPPISDAIGAIFFEEDKAIWAYGSMGRIQRRSLN